MKGSFANRPTRYQHDWLFYAIVLECMFTSNSGTGKQIGQMGQYIKVLLEVRINDKITDLYHKD